MLNRAYPELHDASDCLACVGMRHDIGLVRRGFLDDSLDLVDGKLQIPNRIRWRRNAT